MRSFTISTDRIGPRRWCWVRIHDTVEDLRVSAHRNAPWHEREWWSECVGCFQPTAVRLDKATGEPKEPANGYAGTLRLAEGWVTAEIVAHELIHAALCIYRMNVKPDVRLGQGCGKREEDLAYIYGELYGSFESQWHKEG
jgi:hypothetical protein